MNNVAVTTCKGRLDHLRQTLPLMREAFSSVVVVDCECPDGTMAWILEHARGVRVLHCPGQVFHKTRAANLGARWAIDERSAKRVTFIDADTFISEAAARALNSLSPKQMAVTGPKTAKFSQLAGFVSCPAEAFDTVKGFDETFTGWGYEDMDFRLRLFADAACEPVWIPSEYFSSAKHDREARTRFQPDTIQESCLRNQQLFRYALRDRLADHWSTELKDLCCYR